MKIITLVRINENKFMRSLLSFLLPASYIILYSSCSLSKQISRQANTILLKDSAISTGHIGISIYEPATNKYWYNYNETHYFIPASNTKLFTLYAGMKYLGDSLAGAKYYHLGESLFIQPTGDPTFLHPDFAFQPLFELLKNNKGRIFTDGHTTNPIKKFGRGWNFDDYQYAYMAERNKFPIFGNVLTFSKKPVSNAIPFNDTTASIKKVSGNFSYWVTPKIFSGQITDKTTYFSRIKITRDIDANNFTIENDSTGGERLDVNSIPFATRNGVTAAEILSSILNKEVFNGAQYNPVTTETILYSQPSDSLFKPMMHRSDNFFAEQTLLMASNAKLGYMSDVDMIEFLLKSDLKGLPQRPRWVDGSGLSRYNLFTPKSLVYLLDKMKKEFSWNRLTTILATGGEGTISNYYKKDSGFIYAKTGTLSNNCALSGFMITTKGKLLIFSILANNYITGATPVRRAVERFLEGIRAKY